MIPRGKRHRALGEVRPQDRRRPAVDRGPPAGVPGVGEHQQPAPRRAASTTTCGARSTTSRASPAARTRSRQAGARRRPRRRGRAGRSRAAGRARRSQEPAELVRGVRPRGPGPRCGRAAGPPGGGGPRRSRRSDVLDPRPATRDGRISQRTDRASSRRKNAGSGDEAAPLEAVQPVEEAVAVVVAEQVHAPARGDPRVAVERRDAVQRGSSSAGAAPGARSRGRDRRSSPAAREKTAVCCCRCPGEKTRPRSPLATMRAASPGEGEPAAGVGEGVLAAVVVDEVDGRRRRDDRRDEAARGRPAGPAAADGPAAPAGRSDRGRRAAPGQLDDEQEPRREPEGRSRGATSKARRYSGVSLPSTSR